MLGEHHKYTHKIVGIKLYFKGFTNTLDMNYENKSRIISSLGSWKALWIVIHLLSWKWLEREEDSILSLSLIFFLFKKLRYNWHIILALDMQHKDLISVYIAKWSPQYVQLPSKFDIFLLAIKEKCQVVIWVCQTLFQAPEIQEYTEEPKCILMEAIFPHTKITAVWELSAFRWT